MEGKVARSLGYPWSPNHLILTPERVGHWIGVYERMGFRYTEAEGSLLQPTLQMVSPVILSVRLGSWERSPGPPKSTSHLGKQSQRHLRSQRLLFLFE